MYVTVEIILFESHREYSLMNKESLKEMVSDLGLYRRQ